MFHVMPSSTFPDYLLFSVSSQEYVFFCLFLHFLFDCLIVEFSLIVSAMFLISIYMEIVKRFNEGLWDARSSSHSDVKQHFDDCVGLGVDFPTFYTLYRRAACEFITTSWRQTREEMKCQRNPTGVLGCCVLVLVNHLSPLIC